jgi:Tfp pilus assembly PilM family ATPase
MAKVFNSVIGVDLGLHALKAVHLQRKGSRLAVTGYASRVVGDIPEGDSDAMAHHLKLLFRELGASGKGCVAAVSSPQALLRIIEQPTTPSHLLRDALRLNGLSLLNQDCRDFVLDCDQIPEPPADGAGAGPDAATAPSKPTSRYMVGGLPRSKVTEISSAFAKNRLPVDRLQIATICNYNAFEFSHPEIFNREAFMLVDIGHTETRVLVGAKRELVLARVVDYGGHDFMNAITAGGGIDVDSALLMMEQNDAGMMDIGRNSLYLLARELRSSIGFFEGQREEPITRVYFAGGLVKSLMPLQILSDELEIACNTWDPFQNFHVELPKAKVAAFEGERTHLNVACGAALDLLIAA